MGKKTGAASAMNSTAGKEQQKPAETKTSSGTMKKTVLHNFELPVTAKKVTFHNGAQNNNNNTDSQGLDLNMKPWVVKQNDSAIPSSKRISFTSKYHLPEPNTALKFSKEIKQIQAGKGTTAQASDKILKKIMEETELLRKERVTQQLNFPTQKVIFKNLTPINVNDSVIQMDAKKIVPRKSGIEKSNKDPEPFLADFVDPLPPYKFEDLRSTVKFSAETFRPPDLSNITDQIRAIHEMTDIDY